MGSEPEARLHVVIDNYCAGFIRVADCDAAIERHEEGVGISVKRRVR